MRATFLTARALALHVALAGWLAMCVVAAWWQVARAFSGNSLSFLYAIEWPCFALLGVFAWWQLLHVTKPTSDEEAARREFEERMRADAARARTVASASGDEDPQLAAYNDHLAGLASVPKKKLWEH